jgi:uncharacterized protein involved in type VI secretion and phage assembly
MNHFMGKYRGVVTNNADELRKGRIEVKVVTVRGDYAAWALPCVPYAGHGVGFFAIPPVGANVWIEFEGGKPEQPIWTGCFWGENDEIPVDGSIEDDQAPMLKVLKTETATITLDERQGEAGLAIETASGMTIKLNAEGIEINAGQKGKIVLNQNQVSINDSALEVT